MKLLLLLLFTMVISLCGHSQSKCNYSNEQYLQERINILETIINDRIFDSINNLYNEKHILFGTDTTSMDIVLYKIQKNNPKIKICSRYDFENGYWIYDDIGFGLSQSNTEVAAFQIEYVSNNEGKNLLLGISLEKKKGQWIIIDISIIE
jgi:hypothetical protein